MTTEEQRVRTMAGWIGVEISRSRVRTPGKAGYGLYRVRGSFPVRWSVRPGEEIDRSPGQSEPALWTAYAFTLEEILGEVRAAIASGTPDGPADLGLCDERSAGEQAVFRVPTRWTAAYRGKRNLGVPVPVAVRPEFAAELDALAVLLGAGLVEMVHVEGCGCENAPERMTVACVRATMPERMRQRADNNEFQAEHLKRREWGLRQRHAQKLRRNEGGQGAHSNAERSGGPSEG